MIASPQCIHRYLQQTNIKTGDMKSCFSNASSFPEVGLRLLRKVGRTLHILEPERFLITEKSEEVSGKRRRKDVATPNALYFVEMSVKLVC